MLAVLIPVVAAHAVAGLGLCSGLHALRRALGLHASCSGRGIAADGEKTAQRLLSRAGGVPR